MLLSAFALLASSAVIQPEPLLTDDEARYLLGHLDDRRIDEGIPALSFALIEDGELAASAAFGMADVKRRREATPETPFGLASVTKTFTAVGILMLAEEGAIDLDAPLNDYLGELRVRNSFGPDEEITVRRVLNHTSGLPLFYDLTYADERERRMSPQAMIERFGVTTVVPGDRERYSNLGYGALELAIEEASGLAYEDFIRERIFEPLELASATIATSRRAPRNAAKRYTTGGRSVPGNDTPHRGASAAFMTAEDLARFGQFIIAAWHGESDRLSREMARLMTENGLGNDADEYPGHGLFGGVRDGTLTATHGGSMPGIKARLRIIPEERIAYALLFNHQDSTTEFWFEEDVMAAIDPRLALYTSPITVPEEARGAWRGEAQLSDGSAYPVTLHMTTDEPVATIGGESVPFRSLSTSEGYWMITTEGGKVDLPETDDIRYRIGFEVKRRGEEMIGNMRINRRPEEGRSGGAYSYPLVLRKAE